MAVKRPAMDSMDVDEDAVVDPADELMFLCLGGGNEVGRSCHIIQYKGKTIMLDAGMHPAYDGFAAMPFYDDFDLSSIDILLISHFHIDHAASLPYVLAKTNFRGQVFMTFPTKAIYKWLIQDSVRVGNMSSSSEQRIQLYDEEDHLATFETIQGIDYYTTHTVSSIRITPYPAGHVLGAAMFLIEIAGLNILFTGDYSREQDRHLITASAPPGVKIDVLITESTYGTASHPPREEKEAEFLRTIRGIIDRGGRALLPVFALGRAQEILLILEEYWGSHPEVQNIPIYYASSLARKCMMVYQTYIHAMNDNIKRLFRERMAEAEARGDVAKVGPWDFKYIRSIKNLENFKDVGSCVMLASPGMMQNGVSRKLLEEWAPDQRNGVVITGYSVEGTMAKLIVTEPEFISAVMTRNARQGVQRGKLGKDAGEVQIPRRCTVHEFAFAAHVDGPQNKDFIMECKPDIVILVHGERHLMARFRSKLLHDNEKDDISMSVYAPQNTEELRIPIKQNRIGKIVGDISHLLPAGAELAVKQPQSLDGLRFAGTLVNDDLEMNIMGNQDLNEFGTVTTATMPCKHYLRLATASPELIRWALEGTFGFVTESATSDQSIPSSNSSTDSKSKANLKSATNGIKHAGTDVEADLDLNSIPTEPSTDFLIMDTVTVRCLPRGEVVVEWDGTGINDGIADAVLAVLFTVESSPAAVKRSASSSSPHSHGGAKPKRHPHAAPRSGAERFSRLCLFLEAQFGAANVRPLTAPRRPADGSVDDDDLEWEKREMARLLELGVPVAGVEIAVEKMKATLWLEDLSVESSSAILRDRVKAVADRAVEVIAPLWAE